MHDNLNMLYAQEGDAQALYDIVPRGLEENLRWRRHLIEASLGDSSFQESVIIACQRSILFWVNSFLWLYEPRDWETTCGRRMKGGAIPWVTYDYQDDFLLTLQDCLGREDLCINKSRDMGASFGVLATYLHQWQFNPQALSFLCVSRNETYVESSDNPKALFWKLDWMINKQPGWMLPVFTRTKMKLINEETSSVINGESTTGDVARGDRRTSIMLDEFAAFETTSAYKAMAATRDATENRIFNSTPQGSNNAFYDLWHKPDIRKAALHWTLHPIKSKGRYVEEETGHIRSPWYDEQVKRCAHAWEVRSELDMDFMGSSTQFFDPEMINKKVEEHCIPPLLDGELFYDSQSLEPLYFDTAMSSGRLQLWTALSGDGSPAAGEYVAGIDIAMGTGASSSVISLLNRKTGEKVAEFSSANVSPYDLAHYAVALCRWFNAGDEGGDMPAYMIWEANGPGLQFGKSVIESGFTHFYYRRKDDVRPNSKATDNPGWWTDAKNKKTLLAEYKRGIEQDKIINRSRKALRETLEYIFKDNGEVHHSAALRAMDPSAGKDNHGDFVIADSLAYRAVTERPKRSRPKEIIREGSFMSRRLEAQQLETASSFRW